MVKIAVVLWHADEAGVKQADLPDIWTDVTARMIGNHLEKLEMPIWDLEIQKSYRSWVKMRERLLEARMAAAKAKTDAMKADGSKKELSKKFKEIQTGHEKLVAVKERSGETDNKFTKLGASFVDAIKAQDMEKAARLAAEWRKTSKGKSKANAEELVDEGEKDDDEERSEEDEDEEMGDDGDDPDDSDHVEEGSNIRCGRPGPSMSLRIERRKLALDETLAPTT
ncbi:uncharacterized protein Z519_06245 [Cladophialophora bantiana CBS 173.52]|uniref:Uncharacterized protein n=1 Tax=Cladophialophora bantiana (strain ATCC 10958 / CBS 173.52 / CDC B-1940 / NIH 8579) TaxID=1442370 RepID=A0A0D2HS06_CLAB1|nr:uncharacterized protein Z519_06245 [Cladophialophora bantiana CBS 173.52]KIW93640.1 hypothetical protein Z519_06245 [Cladophialophora bantiana CBS 173.52]